MIRLLAVAWKEFIQLRRDRMTLAMMIGVPVLQLLLFGYAINTDVRHIPTVVYDQDRSAETRGFVQRLVATGFYDVVGEVRSYDEIERALRSRRAQVAVVFPPHFGADAEAGVPTSAQLVVDGTDPQTTQSAIQGAVGLMADRATTLTTARLARAGQHVVLAPMQLEPTTWYNPELRTAVNVVPGLVGVILTMTMVMLTAMALVRERERGTMEQLIVSPVKPLELVVGKMAPYVVIGYVQMSLVLLAGRVVFDVPIVGSLPLLYLVSLFFIAACLAIGLVFSTVASTQQQAMQMSFFFLLPNILLSGFVFPYEGMPRPAQVLSSALPLTHFLRIIRSIVLKGGTLPDVVDEVKVLGLILAILVAVTSLRFRKKLG